MKVTQRAKLAFRRKAPREAGASQAVTGFGDRFRSWLDNHRTVGRDSFNRLMANLLASIMTWLVIGVAIALPTGMYVMLDNAGAVSNSWQSQPRLTLYLKDTVTFKKGLEVSNELLTHPGIAKTQYISATAALAEFKSLSGFSSIVDSLDENPLPAIILASPLHENIEGISALVEELEHLPEVESVVVDIQWLQRLYALLELAQRSILAISVVLALAVALIVGNTIRLAIESRRAEIEVIKLVGGTDAFVRRPFLYTGAWYGVGGGLVAWWLVEASLIWVSGPVAELVGLYGSDFKLHRLGIFAGLSLLVGGAILGLAGAWLAVNRNLKEIQPQ